MVPISFNSVGFCVNSACLNLPLSSLDLAPSFVLYIIRFYLLPHSAFIHPRFCRDIPDPLTGKLIRYCEPKALWSRNATGDASGWSKAVVSLNSGETAVDNDFQLLRPSASLVPAA
ncbi:hypothetical protein TcWFU_004479 [Taenia crassiceps]|uniref:Uncharacterized protein n=1 Tax=Taenia crassiceps TaxID=6207 RepID=A0ABR4QH25_9CEST